MRKRHRASMLIDALVLGALVAIASSAALPLLFVELRADLVDETRCKLDVLRHAIERFYEDNLGFPLALSDLKQKPVWVLGWMGPYVSEDFIDEEADGRTSLNDAWGRAFRYSHPDAYTVTLRSTGADGVDQGGAADDVQLTFAMHYVLWKITMREIRILRACVSAYNANVAPPRLPNPWNAIVNRLQAKGILPLGSYWKFNYWFDGWGREYVDVGPPSYDVTSSGPP